MDVKKFSQKTKREAEDLLRYGDVLNILSKYGKVVLSGSYKYDLMWEADIDLIVMSDKPKESSYHALNGFIKRGKFQKYQLGDFIKYPFKGRPQGMIVVLVHEYKGRRWEIEIWFQKSLPESNKYYDELLSNISEKQRGAILELKYQ